MSISERALSRRERWTAYVIGAFGNGAANSVLFLLPLRARELGAGFEVIGVIVATAALAPAVLSVPLGAMVDRIGARRSFIWSTLASALVLLAATAVTSLWWLLAIQVVFGLTRTVGWISSQSYITGLATGADRAAMTGKFGFFSNLGATLGPLATGLAAQAIGFRWAFVFTAGYAAVFFVLGIMLARTASTSAASRGSRRKGVGFKDAVGLLGIGGIQAALFLAGARLWLQKTFNGFVPVVLVDAGVEAAVAGSVLAVAGFAGTASTPTVGYWVRRARPTTVTAVVLGIGALGVVLVPWLTTIPLVFVPALLFGVGGGMSLPLLMAIITEAAPPDQRGLALGVRQTVNQIASSGAPLLVGPMVGIAGVALAFPLSGAVAATLVAVAVVRAARPSSRPHEPAASV